MSKLHNRPKSPVEIEIAPGYSIQQYVDLKRACNHVEIANLIRTRFDDRFFNPLGYSLAKGEWITFDYSRAGIARPSGWLMLAVSCFAIEALINFTKGTKSIQSVGPDFTAFFAANSAFETLLKAFPAFTNPRNGKPREDNHFYSDIRCGILHQGETCAGWRLLLGEKDGPMVDSSKDMQCIYAIPIMEGVGNSIRDYCDRLTDDADFRCDTKCNWGKALRKLDAISKMCGVDANALGNPVQRKRCGKYVRTKRE